LQPGRCRGPARGELDGVVFRMLMAAYKFFTCLGFRRLLFRSAWGSGFLPIVFQGVRHSTPWKTLGKRPLPQALLPALGNTPPDKIGRASCRERAKPGCAGGGVERGGSAKSTVRVRASDMR